MNLNNWAKQEGYETWLSDHRAVMNNMEAYMNEREREDVQAMERLRGILNLPDIGGNALVERIVKVLAGL